MKKKTKFNLRNFLPFFLGMTIITFAAIVIAPLFKPTLTETMAEINRIKQNGYHLQFVSATLPTIFISWVIFAICALYLKTLPKPDRVGEEHGSATWLDAKTLCEKLRDKEKPENDRILSKNLRISLFGKNALKSLNTMVIGGMGMGKSYFVFLQNLLQANASYVVTDPSGELARRTGWFFKNIAKYKVKVVDTDNLHYSIHYNFFKYIQSEEDILAIVDTIFSATGNGTTTSSQDPMWELMAKSRLIAYITIIFYRGSKEEKNIDTVIYLFEHDQIIRDENGNQLATGVQALFEDEERKNPGNLATRHYLASHRGADETILGIESTLSGRMSYFLLPTVRKLMANDELELEKLGREKTILYLVIPSEKETFNFITSMIYTQAFQLLYAEGKKQKNNKLPVPVQFILDEMPSVQLPTDFDKGVVTARKFDISYMMAIQEISQLEERFKKKWETIIGTCSSTIYLGGSGKHTNEYIEKWIGTETISAQQQSRSYGHAPSSSQSLNQTGRALIFANELDEMKDTDCIVNIKGYGWTKDKKADPTLHPNYKYTADVNNNYYDWSGSDQMKISITPVDSVPEEQEIIEINIDNFDFKKLEKIYDIYESED